MSICPDRAGVRELKEVWAQLGLGELMEPVPPGLVSIARPGAEMVRRVEPVKREPPEDPREMADTEAAFSCTTWERNLFQRRILNLFQLQANPELQATVAKVERVVQAAAAGAAADRAAAVLRAHMAIKDRVDRVAPSGRMVRKEIHS